MRIGAVPQQKPRSRRRSATETCAKHERRIGWSGIRRPPRRRRRERHRGDV